MCLFGLSTSQPHSTLSQSEKYSFLIGFSHMYFEFITLCQIQYRFQMCLLRFSTFWSPLHPLTTTKICFLQIFLIFSVCSSHYPPSPLPFRQFSQEIEIRCVDLVQILDVPCDSVECLILLHTLRLKALPLPLIRKNP